MQLSTSDTSQTNRADEATADFQKAIKCGHTTFMPYLALSHALTSQCTQALQCGCRSQPDHIFQNVPGGGMQACDRFLPRNVNRKAEDDRVTAQKFLAEALATLEDAAERFPQEATVYLYKGQILEQAQRFPEAKKAYKKAFKMDKTNSMPLFHLGLMALRGGASQLAEGMALLQNAVELEPSNVNALRHLGHISMNTKDYKKADFWFGQVLA
jgi:tetratricopeptide (TPR) repeat protein